MKRKTCITLLILVWVVCLAAALIGTFRFSANRVEENTRDALYESMHQIGSGVSSLILDETMLLHDYDNENRAMGQAVAFLQEHDLENALPGKARLRKYAQLRDASYIAVINPKGKTLASYGEELCAGKPAQIMGEREYFKEYLVSSASSNMEDAYAYEVDLEDGNRLRYEISNYELSEIRKNTFSWRKLMNEIELPDGASFYAVSMVDGTILLNENEDLIGKSVSALGFDSIEDFESNFRDPDEDGICWEKGNPAKACMQMYDYLCVVCEMPSGSTQFYVMQVIKSLLPIFGICTLLMLLYIIFSIMYKGHSGKAEETASAAYKRISDMTLTRKIMAWGIIMLVAFSLLSLHIQVLGNMAQESGNQLAFEELTKEATAKNATFRRQLNSWLSKRNIRTARMAEYVVSQDDSLKNRQALKELTEALDISGIYLFGQDGKTIATSTRFDHLDLHENTDSPISKTFLPLLDGWSDRAWTSLTDEAESRDNMYAGVSIRNEEDLCDGCLGIVKELPMTLSESGDYFIFNATLDLASDSYEKDRETLSATQGRIAAFLIADMIVCLLAMLALGTSCLHSSEQAPETEEEQGDKAPAPQSSAKYEEDEFEVLESTLFERAKLEKDEYFPIRWHWNITPLKHRSPEQKIAFILKVLLFIIAVIVVCEYAFRGGPTATGSISENLFSGNWERGFNLYAFTAAELIIVVAIVAVRLVHWMMSLVAYFCSQRGETVCYLVSSLVAYAAIFTVLFYCLVLMGIDAKTILASAGVLTVIIGFGAQSMIADILAGIFIIFEDAIHVGDYVTVQDTLTGNQKGLVMNIGMRITKLKYYGNIISINNAKLIAIKNKSKGDACVMCMLPVSIGEDLQHVEDVIARELPVINKTLHETGYCTSKLQYTGVQSFDSSKYELRFKVFCTSYRHGRVERLLNGELIKMCKRNDIKMS